MKEWFAARTSSEKKMLITAAAILVLLLIYLLLVEPFQQSLQQQRIKVVKQAEDLVWMQETTQQIKSLSAQRKGTGRTSRTPLLTLIDRTVKQHRLGGHMQRLEPKGSGKAQIWLNQVPFDTMIQWLQGLSKQHNVNIGTVSVQRQANSGIVDARVLLESGS